MNAYDVVNSQLRFGFVGASLQGARRKSKNLGATPFGLRQLAPNTEIDLESQLRLERIKWQ
jgi:hypothetical protein